MIHARALLLSCVALTLPLTALAEFSLEKWARTRVEETLLQPLAAKDKKPSRFSREAPPPRSRRARILSKALQRDDQGRGFIPFAVDVRYVEESWDEAFTGCVYEGTGRVFVSVGDGHRPADFLLGKRARTVKGVCRAKAREES